MHFAGSVLAVQVAGRDAFCEAYFVMRRVQFAGGGAVCEVGFAFCGRGPF